MYVNALTNVNQWDLIVKCYWKLFNLQNSKKAGLKLVSETT